MGKKKRDPSDDTSRSLSSKKILKKNGKLKKKVPKLFTLYKCDICNKEFSERSLMVSHQSIHSSDTPFSCPQCSYRGKTKKYLSRHIRQVHEETPETHKCSFCGKFFLHQSGLKVHEMVHTGEKPHSCNVCGKTFRVTYSLNSHMLIHTNEKPFQCSFCSYACRDSSTLRKHQNKHMGLDKMYECKICSKGYKNRAALKIHIAETHLDVDMRKFPCDRCDRVFKNNAHRQMHINSIHERALVCDCPICGRRLMNKNNLASHLRTHLQERPFSCTQPGCSVAFKDKNSLTKHSAIHNPKLHHACAYCGRTFVRRAHVQRHERVMHEERTRGVECHYCGSRFYSKNYLLKHIQTKHIHKQKFKYICDICGLVTHNKPSIVMHLKYGHANDHDLECKICDNKIVYKRHMYLKMHYWNTHNIRYKITRKGTHTKAIMKAKEEKASVEIKVEPIEPDSYEEIQLLDVHKKEIEDDTTEYESLDYSRRVLSEDITESALRERDHGKEVEFDDFFIRHVFSKQEPSAAVSDEVKNDGVNEEQNENVKRRIKQILRRSQKLEKAKALRNKRKLEEKLQREKEIEEEKLKAEKEKQEIVELRRVREMYNERMKAAVAKEKEIKEPVKIKYFKKKPEDSNINKTVPVPEDEENNVENTEDNVNNAENIDENAEFNYECAENNVENAQKYVDGQNNFKNAECNTDETEDYKTRLAETSTGENMSQYKTEEHDKITENLNNYSDTIDTAQDIMLNNDTKLNNKTATLNDDMINYESLTNHETVPKAGILVNDVTLLNGNEVINDDKVTNDETTLNYDTLPNVDMAHNDDIELNVDSSHNFDQKLNFKNSITNSTETANNNNEPSEENIDLIDEKKFANNKPTDTTKTQTNQNFANNTMINENGEYRDKGCQNIEHCEVRDNDATCSNEKTHDNNDNSKNDMKINPDNRPSQECHTSNDVVMDNYEATLPKDNEATCNNETINDNNDTNKNDINNRPSQECHTSNDVVMDNDEATSPNDNDGTCSNETINDNNDTNKNDINNRPSQECHTSNDVVMDNDEATSPNDNDGTCSNEKAHDNNDNSKNDINNRPFQECHTSNVVMDKVTLPDDDHENSTTNKVDTFDRTLLERRVKNKIKLSNSKTNNDEDSSNDDEIPDDDDESWNDSDEDVIESAKAKKMEFKTYQCYVCFKLYQTKQQLIEHCQYHFEICNERTLTKCPICNHVSHKSIAEHMKKKHDVTVKIPFNKIQDRKNTDEGSRYCYDVDGTIVEVIPSIKILNKTASDEIDKKRRETKDKSIAKTKLVKKGNEWIIEKEAINIKFDEIPELTDKELLKCKVTDNDVDRLGQLNSLAKKKGLKIMFPCFKCDKICQNFSALKLHKRRHEDNPVPFKPKVYKRNAKPEIKKKVKLNTANRTALPKPILNKHKCDAKLKEFYETNIRGGDIEFWQFLKIFNKMDREKVNDFKDLENRTDFGNHLDYYKDVANNDELGSDEQ